VVGSKVRQPAKPRETWPVLRFLDPTQPSQPRTTAAAAAAMAASPSPSPAAAAAAEMESTVATVATTLALHDTGLSPQNAAARNKFVQQTSLVLQRIRAGYLVDAFPFPQSKHSSWFCALTTRLPKADKEIAMLHEVSSDTLFIVNRILLLDNLNSRTVPIWVKTDDSSIQVS
jgi:hypothetical protein